MVGHAVRIQQHLMLWMMRMLLVLLLVVMLLLVRPELVKRIEALSATVLNILYMGPEDALFGMTLWL